MRYLLVSLCLVLAIGCAHHSFDTTISQPPASQPRHFTFDHGGIIRGDSAPKDVAIIFTADSYGEGTGHVLDALRRHNVQGSFFLTGNYLRNSEFRPLVRRMIAEGHYVGPHSDQHPLYCAWEDRKHTLITREQFELDLNANLRELYSVGAQKEGKKIFFIPPYEYYNDEQVEWANAMNVEIFNLTPSVGTNRDYIPEGEKGFRPSAQILQDVWTFESRDPAGLNGTILLVHLGSLRQDKFFDLLDDFVTALQKRGYHPIRIDQLLSPAR